MIFKTVEYLDSEGYVKKKLLNTDTNEVVKESYYDKELGQRIYTDVDSILRLEPGNPNDRGGLWLSYRDGSVYRENERRIANFTAHKRGDNPCVRKESLYHESFIPERTYEGWWRLVGY